MMMMTSAFKDHILQLKTICKEIGEPVEGNCFTIHLNIDNESEDLVAKQRNLFQLGTEAINILEIGFNAGHSALIFLTANANSKIVCFDICTHKYTIPCFQYLQSQFPNRLCLIQGDSKNTLPAFLLENQEATFDLIHIDGNHETLNAHSDFLNCLMLATKYIVWDDSNVPNLKTLMELYINKGFVKKVVRDSFVSTKLYEHQILKIRRKK